MFPQEAQSKYKNIITEYGVEDASKGKNLFLDVVPGQREFAKLEWLSVFIKHKKITSNFKRRSD